MSTTRESEQSAIRLWIDQLIDAICSKDLDRLRTLYADDIVSFDVQPPLQHVGVDAKLKNWTEAFSLFVTIEYDVQDVTVTVREDLAIGHGFFRLSGTLANGSSVPGSWVRWTGCFRQQDDAWVVFHDQVSFPFDPVLGKAALDLVP